MDKIIKVNGFGVGYNFRTQTDYMLVALTENGKVLMSTGDGHWCDVTGNSKIEQLEDGE